ncbi:MAG: molybdopterin-dependent oxidoreductase [Desulfobacteraceae bacterium]|jgi:putative selenate reductase molybdopterin-binding subunit|nr:molybdopterin-dependent oxidoreductase [Desulfobacteraceae bacterium]
MEEYSVVGKRIPNRDSVEKVKGSAIFIDDIKLKGMLYGKILRSPLPHAKIANIDVSKAQKLIGVKAIITGKDTLREKFSISPTWADKLVLENEKVRYIGDEIAGVAAVDEDTAQEALDLIQVDFEELQGVFDPVEAMKPGAPIIHDSVENNISKVIPLECGNIEEAFASADLILEDTFTTQAQSHCSLETHCCAAVCEPNGQIKIWVNAQAPHALRQRLSLILGIDASKIHVITPFVGGGFGSKIDLEPSQAISVLLAKKSGKPVRISNTRKEQFEVTRIRHSTISEMKFGVKHDGTIVAKQAKVIMDNGAYNSHGPAVLAYNNVMFSTLYRVENIKYEGYLVYTNKNWGGAFRGYGDPQASFGQEVMMDMVAEQLNMDPIELRLKNANNPNETTANKVRITSCGLKECLRQAKEASNWDEKKEKKSKYRGMGVASMTYTGGGSIGSGFNFSGATVQMNPDGVIHLLVGATDIGQGSNTILTQMAAEILAVDPETIRLTASDTDTTLPCMGTFGSRVTYCAGSAVTQAANDLKLQILENAAEMLEANIEDLEIKDRKVFVKGSTTKPLSYAEIGATSFYKKKKPLVAHGYYNGPEVTEDFDPISYRGYPSPAMVFATHIAEVQIDPGTGKVDVINFVAAHDVGKAINPLLVEGQIEGGIAQGIGWTLTEDLKFENGRIINPNFHDYKILTIKDITKITPILIETIDPNGPFGAKGIGECAMVPTAPAIVNAIYDAIGVRIKDLPATPEKIFQGIKQKELRRNSHS